MNRVRSDPTNRPPRRRLPSAGSGCPRTAAGVLLLVLLGFSALAAVPPKDAVSIGATGDVEWEAFVDEVMARQFEEYRLAGASVTIVRGGEIVLSKGYGFADLEAGVPVDPARTVFATASVAKPFAWTAVMQLVERGELELDADVNAYLTAFEIPERFGEPIRIRHLLAHTAGFEDKPVAGLLSRTGGPGLEASLVRYMPARVWPPGLYVAYSNYGAALAGYIVAEVSGRPWEEYLEAAILEPLEMTRSSGRQPIPDHLAGDMSKAYHVGSQGLIETDHEYVPLSPAGGMVSTTEDMANFLIAHLQNGAFGEGRILDEATTRRMHAQLFTHDERLPGNAHGFWEGVQNGQRYLDHGGDTASYTLLVLVPEHELGFYLAYNSPDGALAREAFREAFFDHVFPPPSSSAATGAVPPASGSLAALTGTYGINRLSTTTLTKLIGLGGALAVSSEDGLLVTEMPVIGRQVWAEEEPFSFTEVGGSERVIFRANDRGQVEQIFFSGMPEAAFTPIAWNDRIELHGALLAVALLALLSSLLAWPFFGRQDHAGGGTKSIGERILRRLPAIAGAFFFLFFVALGLFLLDPLEVEFGMPPVLVVALSLGLVACGLTLASLVFAFLAWRRRSWSTIERAHYTFVALACVSLTWQLHNWNLLGFRV